jgi:hypothetical protein
VEEDLKFDVWGFPGVWSLALGAFVQGSFFGNSAAGVPME